MARLLAVAVVGAVLLTAGGCKSSPDSLVKEMIAGMNRLADSIEKGEPEEKQKAIAEKIKDTSEKLKKLNLTADQQKALGEKHSAELMAAFKRIVEARSKRAGNNAGPGALDFLANPFK